MDEEMDEAGKMKRKKRKEKKGGGT